MCTLGAVTFHAPQRLVQRRGPVPARRDRVRCRASEHEQPAHPLLPRARGDVQRGIALGSPRLFHARALRQQEPRQRPFTSGDSLVQRRHRTRRAGFVHVVSPRVDLHRECRHVGVRGPRQLQVAGYLAPRILAPGHARVRRCRSPTVQRTRIGSVLHEHLRHRPFPGEARVVQRGPSPVQRVGRVGVRARPHRSLDGVDVARRRSAEQPLDRLRIRALPRPRLELGP